MNDTLTAVLGMRVGHSTDRDAMTGLTVVIPPDGAVAGVSVRGAAPGTRELGPLRPASTVTRVDAIVLSGGSAFGLDSAAGVMQYLAARGQGVRVGEHVVPIVPAAILFDLSVGLPRSPSPADAESACAGAVPDPVEQGSVGAGIGCTVGKLAGMQRAMRGGLGSAAVSLEGGGIVAALAVVNAVGDVVDEQGKILAGTRDGSGFQNSEEFLIGGGMARQESGHTTLVVVATDVQMDKTECSRMAGLAHNGLARSIRPCHTSMDGDIVFAVSAGELNVHTDRVGAAAVQVVASAIRRGVCAAESGGTIPAYRDIAR